MRPEQRLWLAVVATAVADYLRAKSNKEEPWIDDEAIAFLDYHYPAIMTRLRSIRGKKAMWKLLDTIEENLEKING